jgi:hypothetical protein
MQMLYFGLLTKSTSVFTSRSLQLYGHFFEDLLSLPQPADDELVDGLPVVQCQRTPTCLLTSFRCFTTSTNMALMKKHSLCSLPAKNAHSTGDP